MKAIPVDCNHGEILIACAEVMLEDQDWFPARREKVEAIKAWFRESSEETQMGPFALALAWMATFAALEYRVEISEMKLASKAAANNLIEFEREQR